MRIRSLYVLGIMIICLSSCNYYNRLSNKIKRYNLSDDIVIINNGLNPFHFHKDKLCTADTFETTLKLFSADKKYTLWGFNSSSSTLSIKTIDGKTISADTVIEIKKGQLLSFLVRSWINKDEYNVQEMIENTKPCEYYLSSDHYSKDSFLESGFYISPNNRCNYIQVTLRFNTQYYLEMLDFDKNQIILKRSDCRNKDGFFIDFRGGKVITTSLIFNGNPILKDTLTHSDRRFFLGDLENGNYNLLIESFEKENPEKENIALIIAN